MSSEPKMSDAQEVRRILRDVVALSTLPAMWLGAEPLRIVESLAASLFTTLGPEFVYVCFSDGAGRPAVEVAQITRYDTNSLLAKEVGPAMLDWARNHDPDDLLILPNPLRSGTLRITARAIGFQAELGVIAAAFADQTSPSSAHHLILNVAATQAATALSNTRLLHSLRESEQRVRQSNIELSEHVAELQRLNAELRHARRTALDIMEDALTARQQAEKAATALRESEERFRNMANHAPVMVWVTESDGTCTFLSESWYEFTGQTPETGLGFGRLAAAHPDDREQVEQLFTAANERREAFRLEYRLRHRDGEYRWAIDSATPRFGPDGTFLGYIGSVLDITERKRTEDDRERLLEREQELRQQAEQASRLKDEFLMTVSHELRTPLTAFLGYAQMLQRRARDEAYVGRTVEKMVRSAKTQAQIIEDLLDVSRIVSGKLRLEPELIDLATVVRAALDTVRPAAEAKGLQLKVDLSSDANMIVGDASRLQQVVWNLLSNATKFTPPGGSIHVRLERHGRDAQLTVSDTGQGISASFLPYVFDRFRQADSTSNRAYGGLGLGLAIVRHLVELHGGTVQAASAGEGQGATFTMRLPFVVSGDVPTLINGAIDKGGVMSDCPPELLGLRVLLAVDQPDVLGRLYEILSPCGAVVRMCATAREALEVVRAWQPEVLVSDIAMPGEDGYWLIRNVRALAAQDGGTVPAVALTAYVRLEENMRALEAGFQLYVPKPVEPVELRAVIAHLARVTVIE